MATHTVGIQGLHLASEGNDLVVCVRVGDQIHEVIREDWRSLGDGGQLYHSVTSTGLDALISGECV